MARSVREAFEQGTAAFNAHDVAAFAAVLSDDVVFEAPGGVRGRGKEACAEFFGGWFKAFPDARVDVHALHVTGDVAVEEGTFSGTHRGVLHSPSGDVAPTGRTVTIGYTQVLRFRNGDHISFNLMFDRLTLLEQLGVIPAST